MTTLVGIVILGLLCLFILFLLAVKYVFWVYGILGCDWLEASQKWKNGEKEFQRYLAEKYFQQRDLLMIRLLRRYNKARVETFTDEEGALFCQHQNLCLVLSNPNTDFDIKLLDKCQLIIKHPFLDKDGKECLLEAVFHNALTKDEDGLGSIIKDFRNLWFASRIIPSDIRETLRTSLSKV